MAVLRKIAVVALVSLGGAAAIKVERAEPSTEDRLAALQPVLEKLRGLDPKTFGMLSGVLSQAGTGDVSKRGDSLLQIVDPNDDAQDKLEKLGPVLEKLRGLDSKTFGMLSSMLSQASSVQRGNSFLQVVDPDASAKLEALQPVLEKLRGLDPKTFGMLSGILGQAGSKEGVSLLQVLRGDDPDTANKLEALQPVLEKLRGLDPKTFGMLSGMLGQARSFVQIDEPDASAKLEALQPVLEKLRGLDPKTFGMLSGMLSQAGTKEGVSLLQVLGGDDPSVADKLEALQPVLAKLKGLDPKTFGMLSNMMAQAKASN